LGSCEVKASHAETFDQRAGCRGTAEAFEECVGRGLVALEQHPRDQFGIGVRHAVLNDAPIQVYEMLIGAAIRGERDREFANVAEFERLVAVHGDARIVV